MKRVNWVDHKGKKILYGNLKDTVPEDWPEIDKQYNECFIGMPEKSIISLIACENAHFNTEVLMALKERAKKDTPYVKKTAFTGITGLKKVVLGNILKFADREAKVFDSDEEAMDWLVLDED